MFNDSIDKVRQAEHKAPLSEGDNRWLEATDWLKHPGNIAQAMSYNRIWCLSS